MKNNHRSCDADAGTRPGNADTIAEDGMASKEDKYIEQLKELGVWTEAFYPAVHQLCTQERELSRVQKAWKATQPEGEKHPDFTHELYGVITQLRRDIRASRDELGLTPKALKRLKGAAPASPDAPQQGIISRLDEIKRRVEAYDYG